jgi:hypothetical protein
MRPRCDRRSVAPARRQFRQTGRMTLALGCLLALLFSALPAQAQQPSFEGTYRLVARKLGDGTSVNPSDFIGVMRMAHGIWNANIAWKEDGKWGTHSFVSTYQIVGDRFVDTLLFRVFIASTGAVERTFNTTGRTASYPITVSGDRVTLGARPLHVFEGKTMTAGIEGVFTDTWEKIE